MKALLKGSIATKLIVVILVMALSMAFCISASAYSTFYREGEIIPHGDTVITSFNSGSDNKITMSATAYSGEIGSGSYSQVLFTLEKYNNGAWSNVNRVLVKYPHMGDTKAVWDTYPISQNTEYRIKAQIYDGNAITGKVGMGIVLWN